MEVNIPLEESVLSNTIRQPVYEYLPVHRSWTWTDTSEWGWNWDALEEGGIEIKFQVQPNFSLNISSHRTMGNKVTLFLSEDSD